MPSLGRTFSRTSRGPSPTRGALLLAPSIGYDPSVVRALAIVTIALAACDDPVTIPPECNGALELCDRRYDEVAYPTTHNAMSNAADGWERPNQNVGIAAQLDDGVRGLMLDVHDWDDEPTLCHALCPLGSLPLVDGLRTIKSFLDRHRGEVVTIIFESYVPAADIAAAFDASGADHYVRAQAPGTAWPTLRELIDADQRLIVFTDNDGGGTYPWYMDVWAHAWETPFSAETTDDFVCDMNRGDRANELFIFNHFLTRTFAVPEEADTTNADPFLLDRARQCAADAGGDLPNFVTVDFYDQGDLFEAVNALNELD